MASLVLCSACRRHVRRHEAQCPFCGAARAPSLNPPRARGFALDAKRATLVALGLTLAGGQACGGKEDDRERDNVGVIPPYGLSNFDDPAGSGGSASGAGGSGGASGSGDDSGTRVPPYGLSPFIPPDGGSGGGADTPDSGTPPDAGGDDAGGNDAGGTADEDAGN